VHPAAIPQEIGLKKQLAKIGHLRLRATGIRRRAHPLHGFVGFFEGCVLLGDKPPRILVETKQGLPERQTASEQDSGARSQDRRQDRDSQSYANTVSFCIHGLMAGLRLLYQDIRKHHLCNKRTTILGICGESF
jgi:hypothetical protein